MSIIFIIFTMFNIHSMQIDLSHINGHNKNIIPDGMDIEQLVVANNIMEHYKNLSLENLTTVFEGVTYTEEWEDIVGFEGKYQISTFGRLKSLKRESGNNKNKYDLIVKQSINKWGYLECHLTNDKVFMRRTNRLVAFAFIPNPENKPQVNHKDGVKINNCIWNLEWMTRSENDLHAHRIGLKNQTGDNNNGRKLNSTQVVEMRKLHATGNYKLKELSDIYKVVESHVWLIVNNGIWKSLL